jgi:ABC-type glycerol-3-phosphate transport system permease component
MSMSCPKRHRLPVIAAESLLFIILIVFTMLPILWGVLTSFKSDRVVLAYPPKIFNFTPVLSNFATLFEGGYLKSLLNSIFYSGTSIILGLILGMLAAYGLRRCRFRLRKLFFYMVIAGIPLSIGSAALLIPNFIYFFSIGITDRFYTLPLLYTAYNLPMAIWIMCGGIENIPIEIEESAAIDGCSRFYIISILTPRLNQPAMASAAIFIFIGSWNEFIVASVMINSTSLRPIQLAIYQYMGYFGLNWGPLCAATTLSVIPVLLVFLLLGKYLVSGLMQGSVKG